MGRLPSCEFVFSRYPFHFFLFNFFFLLASCFLFLHFKAFPNSSFNIELWSRQERDKEVCRKKGIGDFPLCSSILYCFPVRGIKEFTHQRNPYAKWGVVIPESSLERNLPWQFSPHIWLSKKPVSLCMAVFPRGVKLLFQCTKLKMEFCFNLSFQLPLQDTR